MPKFVAYIVPLKLNMPDYIERPVGMNNLVAFGEYDNIRNFIKCTLSDPETRCPVNHTVAIFDISRHQDNFIRYL